MRYKDSHDLYESGYKRVIVVITNNIVQQSETLAFQNHVTPTTHTSLSVYNNIPSTGNSHLLSTARRSTVPITISTSHFRRSTTSTTSSTTILSSTITPVARSTTIPASSSTTTSVTSFKTQVARSTFVSSSSAVPALHCFSRPIPLAISLVPCGGMG